MAAATNNRQQAIALRQLADRRVGISGDDYAARVGKLDLASTLGNARSTLGEQDQAIAYNQRRLQAFDGDGSLPTLRGMERLARAGSVGNTKEAAAYIAVGNASWFTPDQVKFVQDLVVGGGRGYLEKLFYVVNLDGNGNAAATPAFPTAGFTANRDSGRKGGVFKLAVEKISASGRPSVSKLTVGSPGYVKHARDTGTLSTHLWLAANLLGFPVTLREVEANLKGIAAEVKARYAFTVTDAQRAYGVVGSVIANVTNPNKDFRLGPEALGALRAADGKLQVGRGALKGMAGGRALRKPFGKSLYTARDGVCDPFRTLQASGNTTNPTSLRAGLRSKTSRTDPNSSTQTCVFGSYQQDPTRVSAFAQQRFGLTKDDVGTLQSALRRKGAADLAELRAMQQAYNADAPAHRNGAKWRSDDGWDSQWGRTALVNNARVKSALRAASAKEGEGYDDFDFDY